MQLGFGDCFPQSGWKKLKSQARVPWQMVFERFLTTTENTAFGTKQVLPSQHCQLQKALP